MLFKALTIAATMSLVVQASDQVHGQGAKGTTMGPVAFLWPADRPWSANHDNIPPCGSDAPIGNRTQFPLGAAGAVAFSIADESTNIKLRIAHGNNPTKLEDFEQFHGTISKFEEGHQCYSVPASPSSVVAGSNATLQLEYWGNDSGKDEHFYACADITFVEAVTFSTKIPCFNVTASEFTPAGSTPSPTTPSVANASPNAYGSSKGLTTAEKAGIAVSVIVGAFLVASVAFFMLRRRRSPAADAENAPSMTKVASFQSGDANRKL